MYYLLGEKECLRTLLLVATRGRGIVSSPLVLKQEYADFCAEVGGEESRPAPHSGLACSEEVRIRALVAKYTDYSQLTDLETDVIDTPEYARSQAMERVLDGVGHIAHVDPGLARTFTLYIHTLFYQRSNTSGGGSVSSAPGVIWCVPRRTWSQNDISEFLVHDLAHNVLFLDERRFGHYWDHTRLAHNSTFALSAVLRIPRPLDKVFHSLVVANEVLAFRQENGEPVSPVVHPPSGELISACEATIASIKAVTANVELVTPRFLEVIGAIENHVESMAGLSYLATATRYASN